jgi:transcriptional regulator GlxA family with amidase domain
MFLSEQFLYLSPDAQKNVYAHQETRTQASQFKRKLDVVLEQYYAVPSSKISDIASALAMSERKLQLLCKKFFGITPVQYRRKFRVAKAKRLMERNPNWTKTKVAMETGFANLSMLCKALKAEKIGNT